MYQMLLNLWITRRATEITVRNAAARGAISQSEAEMILQTPQMPAGT